MPNLSISINADWALLSFEGAEEGLEERVDIVPVMVEEEDAERVQEFVEELDKPQIDLGKQQFQFNFSN